MRLTALSVLLVVCVVVGEWSSVECKKSSSRSSVSSRPRSSSGGKKSSKAAAAAAGRSKRRSVVEEEDEDDLAGPSFLDEEDEEEPEPEPRRRASSSGKKSASRRAPPVKRSGGATRRSTPRHDRKGRSRSSRDVEEEEYDDEEENYDDDYDEEEYDDYRPRRRSSSSSSRGGRVVPYPSRNNNNRRSRRPPSTFTRGLAALRENMPDPNAVASATLGSLRAARDTASSLSTKVVREVKGLTSSELEQVMLKATRPDDAPVKGKHVERLVGVTYQISGKYDIYDAVLRKLWNKLTEPDARTKMKALYVLHRFSSDGAPDHRAALKARLRELRRTRDPKSKTKERYFNSKRLTVDEDERDREHETGDDKEKARRYAAYLERYGRYVLLRAQCFGGPFVEIADPPSPPRKSAKSKKNNNVPLTASRLRADHLEGAAMVLEAGRACALKDGECVEHTASAAERVAADLLGLTAATAVALDRALSKDDHENKALLKRWCVFYREDLLPKTKALVRKVSPKLDRYGLFLPSRLAANVRPELLDKGLRYDDDEIEKENDNNKKDDTEEETKDEVAEEVDTISSSQKVSASSTQDDEEDEDEVEDEDEDNEDEVEDEDDEDDEDVPAKSAPSKSKESAYEDEEDDEDDGYDYEEVEEYYDEE